MTKHLLLWPHVTGYTNKLGINNPCPENLHNEFMGSGGQIRQIYKIIQGKAKNSAVGF